MKNKNKRLVILLIILLLIVIVMINLFPKVATSSNDENEKNEYKDEELSIEYKVEGKYTPSVINAEYSRLTQEEVSALDNTIDYILKCINTKNYTDLYSKIRFEYADIHFNDMDKFQKYLEQEFPDTEYICTSYRIKNNSAYMTIEGKNQSDTKITREIKIKNYTNIGNMLIYFEDVEKIEKATTFFDISNLTLRTKYLVEYNDKVSLYLEISNATSESEEVVFENAQLITSIAGQEKTKELKEKKTIEIPAKETIQLNLDFEKDSGISILPKSVALNVKCNEKTHEIESMFMFEDLE